MKYLIDIPENLNENGLSKTFLVRRETIHLKHILSVLFKDVDLGVKLNVKLEKYMHIFTKILCNLYKIDRDYNYNLKDILSIKKDKFCDYLKLFAFFNPIIYLDKNLSYHFIANFKMEYKTYDIRVINIKNIHSEESITNNFNFIIGADGADLSGYWFYNFKTYHYRNKTIRNFTLYDKE